jgi:chromosome partitioning protein
VEDPLLTAAAEAPGVGADPAHAAEAPTARPYVLVLGNEKGGTGKSTTAVHVIVGLLQLGYRVGSLDVDGRQGTLSAYLGNRARAIKKTGADLAMPLHRRVEGTTAESRARSFEHETERFTKAFADLAGCQFVVVDTPGSDANLTRLGHGIADTLITPVNDSFLDLDVIAKLNAASRQVLAPSVYTQMVWEQNNLRVVEGRAPIDWVVMRNRMTHIDSRNKREIAALLDKLAGRVGFRIAPGFGERMIFRELFLRGLTLLDVPETSDPRGANASHAAARREVANLLSAIGVPAPALSREAGS